ncbi:MAG TPA: RecX family transcriptional regulator [bacterium]|nr:RecX family transcriptional regulator [bacterium]HOM26787.1 RecX family transcriptional regulator [bacterium]
MKNEELIKKILKLLSKKDYSEEEIREKIPSITPSILKELKKKNLIDDYSLSLKIIENLQNKGKGYHYIFKELERRKIKDQIIEKLKKEYDFEKEVEICKKVVSRMEGKSISSIILNLKSRGFSEEIIEKVINF